MAKTWTRDTPGLVPRRGWYYPHSHETVQLEMGLYGALIVRGPNEPELDAERVFVLDDIRLDKQGQVAPFGGIVEHHDRVEVHA